MKEGGRLCTSQSRSPEPVVISSKAWNAATVTNPLNLRGKWSPVFWNSPLLLLPPADLCSHRAVQWCSHTWVRGAAVERRRQWVARSTPVTSTCFCPLGKRNKSFQEVKPSASHAMNTLNRSVLNCLPCFLC